MSKVTSNYTKLLRCCVPHRLKYSKIKYKNTISSSEITDDKLLPFLLRKECRLYMEFHSFIPFLLRSKLSMYWTVRLFIITTTAVSSVAMEFQLLLFLNLQIACC